MPQPLPRFGAHTFGFAFDRDAETAFAALIENGFSTLELMATPPHFNPWSSPRSTQTRMRRMIENARARLVALDLASSDINLASPAPEVVAFAVSSYRSAIERAGELGAEAICVGSGRRHALLAHINHTLMESFGPAFEQILEAARNAQIKVLIENHPQGLLPDAAGIERFITTNGYTDVRVIYDVTNAAAAGEDPCDGLRVLLPHTDIVHLSDSPRGQWRHDAIGSGDIDFDRIRKTLEEGNYIGDVILEVIGAAPLAGLVEGVARLRAQGWTR